MPKIYLVRHGKAAAGFDGHADPGLDDLGRAQAAATARVLAPLGPLALWSSPLARARETALPLAQAWRCPVIIEPRLAEIPSPTDDLAARAAWLRTAMQGTWPTLTAELLAWRDAIGECLRGIDRDTVITSHYVAINAAVGLATDDDRMVIFAPDNGSVTVFDNGGGQLRVLTLGATADTFVN
jgi:broad specificity phosphatase PhoE